MQLEGILFWGCTFGRFYVACNYLHASWEFCSVSLVEFMSLVFTHIVIMPYENYCRWLRSSLLHLSDASWALVNSLVCGYFVILIGAPEADLHIYIIKVRGLQVWPKATAAVKTKFHCKHPPQKNSTTKNLKCKAFVFLTWQTNVPGQKMACFKAARQQTAAWPENNEDGETSYLCALHN